MTGKLNMSRHYQDGTGTGARCFELRRAYVHTLSWKWGRENFVQEVSKAVYLVDFQTEISLQAPLCVIS